MKEIDDDCVGFNLQTQKLLCLIALDDRVAKSLSHKAGDAFIRAFVVEDRKTGEVLMNQRYRYTDGDSWYRVRLDPEKQRRLTREQKIRFLVDGIAKVLRMAVSLLANAPAPEDVVGCHYPPEPDDADKTVEWLIAQNLIEITSVVMPDGRKVPVTKGTDSVL